MPSKNTLGLVNMSPKDSNSNLEFTLPKPILRSRALDVNSSDQGIGNEPSTNVRSYLDLDRYNSASAALRSDPTGLFGMDSGSVDCGLEESINQVLFWADQSDRQNSKETEDWGHVPTANQLKTDSFKTSNNSLKLYVDSDYFTEGLIPGIRNAEKSITIAVSRFGDDFISQQVLNELVAKASAGVKVIVIVSSFVSSATNGEAALNTIFPEREISHLKPLQDASGIVLNTNLIRNGLEHRKVTIIDSRQAFLGGTAIDDAYYTNKNFREFFAEALATGMAPMNHDQETNSPGLACPSPSDGVPDWHDLQVEIRGDSVLQLQTNILMSALYLGGSIYPQDGTDKKSLRDFWFPTPMTNPGKDIVKIGQSIPFKRNEFLASAKALIGQAKESIYLHSAYLTCPDFHDCIRDALKRGVEVFIGLPGGYDKLMAHRGFEAEIADSMAIAKGKLHVYLFSKDLNAGRSGYNHDKWIVADHRYAWVATGNPEPFSLYQGFDASFTADSQSLSRDLVRLFTKDAINSEILTEEQLASPTWTEYFERGLSKLFFKAMHVLLSPMRTKDEIY